MFSTDEVTHKSFTFSPCCFCKENVNLEIQFTNAFPCSSDGTVVKIWHENIRDGPQQSELEELAEEKKYRAMVTEK